MTNTFNEKTTMFLVDFENNTIINYGESEEMVTQMDQSHGNLFVVGYENLNKEMKNQLEINNILEQAYKEEDQ